MAVLFFIQLDHLQQWPHWSGRQSCAETDHQFKPRHVVFVCVDQSREQCWRITTSGLSAHSTGPSPYQASLDWENQLRWNANRRIDSSANATSPCKVSNGHTISYSIKLCSSLFGRLLFHRRACLVSNHTGPLRPQIRQRRSGWRVGLRWCRYLTPCKLLTASHKSRQDSIVIYMGDGIMKFLLRVIERVN